MKKLILRKSSERGNKSVLFIDQALFYSDENDLYLRAKDLRLNYAFLDALHSSQWVGKDLILLHHAPEVARSFQTEKQLREMSEVIKEKFEGFNLLDVIYCIHCEESDGNAALCIPCSCHPKKGGMMLNAAIKHGLSLSKSSYLSKTKEFAQVAKSFGVDTLDLNQL